MVNWERRWKNFGNGWFGQSYRHSQAAKYGRAGGYYAKKARKIEPGKVTVIPPSRQLEPIKVPPGDPVAGAIDTMMEIQTARKPGDLTSWRSFTPEEKVAYEKKQALEAKKDKDFTDITKVSAKEIGEKAEQEKQVGLGEKERRLWTKEERATMKLGREMTKRTAAKTAMLKHIKEGKSLQEAYDETAKDLILKDKDTVTALLTPQERHELKVLAFKEKAPVKALVKVGEHTVEAVKKTAGLIVPQYKPLSKRVEETVAKRKLEAMAAEKRRVESAHARELISGPPDADPLSRQNAGVFDPLGQLGVDDEVHPMIESYDFVGIEDAAPSPAELYPHAYNTKRLVDDFHLSLSELERNRLDRLFKEGESAYKAGNREKLVNTIMDIDAERRTLMDRKQLVENVRSKVLDDQNAVELLHKDDHASGGFMGGLSGLFGGAISGELTEQTKKVNESRRVVDEALQKGVSYSDNMRAKLSRMDSGTDYGKFEPPAPADVTPFNIKSGFSLDFHNPLLGAKNLLVNKSVKNPVLGGVKLVI